MSTGAECHFTEDSPGQWTYWLQDWPYGDNPDGQTYGPFRSFAKALDHLTENHANPGGWSVRCLKDGRHLHEWGEGSEWVKVGWKVEIVVKSLGPDATPEQVIEFIKGLPADHPAWRLRPEQEWQDGFIKCAACGEKKEPK
jgi:hypothetical protein